MKKKVVDGIINRLLKVRERIGNNFALSECEIGQLCKASSKIFLEQPILLEVEPPINICGDIHGQYSDLLRIFECGGYPPHADYLFLGDYVDRGEQGLETICLLLAYKIKYPKNFFILRGNHEAAAICKRDGFYKECKERFNDELWDTFIECFNCLPVAAVVGEKIFCVHGGIFPDLDNLDQIRKITRPTDVPSDGLLCNLLWSDPSKEIYGWAANRDRSKSNTICAFGPDKVTEFLQKHDLDLICRAHQAVDGYEFFAGQQLVTILSAPNYRGYYANPGAIMSVDENLRCSFQLIEPSYEKSTKGIKSSLDKEINDLKVEIGEVTTKLKALTTKLEQLEGKRGRRRSSPARYD